MNQLLAICDRETILVKTLSAYLKDRFHFPIMAFDDADRFWHLKRNGRKRISA